MQYRTRTFWAVLLLSGFLVAPTPAQQNAQDRAASLRAQLADVQAKQTESQLRLQELEEALKPENIAQSLAGVGSTHPEELREQRRRQLEKERAAVSAQLEQLAISRTRLETAIARADNEAYQQGARPSLPGANAKGPSAAGAENSSTAQRPATHRRSRQVKKHKARRSKQSPN